MDDTLRRRSGLDYILERGGPEPRVPCLLPWMPASAGMTMRDASVGVDSLAMSARPASVGPARRGGEPDPVHTRMSSTAACLKLRLRSMSCAVVCSLFAIRHG